MRYYLSILVLAVLIPAIPTLAFNDLRIETTMVFGSTYYPKPCQNDEPKNAFEQFQRGVCLSIVKIMEIYAPTEFTIVNWADEKQIIDALQDSVPADSPRLEDTFGQFLLGLSHCRQATQLMDSETFDDLLNFCSHRQRSQNIFKHLPWPSLDYSFVKDDTLPSWWPSISDQLIRNLNACYSGPLASMHSSKCLQSNGISAGHRINVAKEAVDIAMERAFGSTGPITAMVNDKIIQTKHPMKIAQAKLTQLLSESSEIGIQYNTINDTVVPTFAPLSDALEDYKLAYSDAAEVQDWYRRWMSGLLLSISGEDRRRQLLDSVQYLPWNQEVWDKQYRELADLNSSVRDVIQRSNRYRKNVKRLCLVYYCEYKNGYSDVKQAFDSLCRTTEFADSPFCRPNQNIIGESESSYTVDEICQQADVSDRYRSLNLSFTTRRQCLQELNDGIEE